MIEDRRTIEGQPSMYVVCTDTFLSGWGHAQGRSLYALAIHDGDDPDVVIRNAEGRTDMKRPRIVLGLKADGTPKVRMGAGDHLAIVDRGEAGPWYEAGRW